MRKPIAAAELARRDGRGREDGPDRLRRHSFPRRPPPGGRRVGAAARPRRRRAVPRCRPTRAHLLTDCSTPLTDRLRLRHCSPGSAAAAAAAAAEPAAAASAYAERASAAVSHDAAALGRCRQRDAGTVQPLSPRPIVTHLLRRLVVFSHGERSRAAWASVMQFRPAAAQTACLRFVVNTPNLR